MSPRPHSFQIRKECPSDCWKQALSSWAQIRRKINTKTGAMEAEEKLKFTEKPKNYFEYKKANGKNISRSRTKRRRAKRRVFTLRMWNLNWKRNIALHELESRKPPSVSERTAEREENVLGTNTNTAESAELANMCKAGKASLSARYVFRSHNFYFHSCSDKFSQLTLGFFSLRNSSMQLLSFSQKWRRKKSFFSSLSRISRCGADDRRYKQLAKKKLARSLMFGEWGVDRGWW